MRQSSDHSRNGFARFTRLLLALVIFLTAWSTIFCMQGFAETPEPVNLTDKLTYRFGDSPVQDGHFVWLEDSLEKEVWSSYIPWSPPLSTRYDDIWLRIKLPENQYEAPALSFTAYARSIEVYLENQLIYKSSDPQVIDLRNPDFIISLPAHSENKTMYFRLKYAYPDTAGYIANLTMGIKSDLYAMKANSILWMMPYRTRDLILSALFIFSGIVLVLAFLLIRGRPANFLNLGFSSICMGLWVMAFYIPDWHVKILVSSIGGHLMPIGFVAFTERMFARRMKPAFKVLRILLWLSTVLNLILDLSNILSWAYSISIFHVLLIISVIPAVFSVIGAAIKGNRDARLYAIGFSILSLLGILDVVSLFYVTIPWKLGLISPWGMFFLILVMVYIVVRDFDKMNKQLLDYSKEIELKNQKLEKASDEIIQWNKTLEIKVSERTRELEDANFELSCAMDDLKTTQTQLVQSEKIAAMSSLVAGLLHEINTPLGAIKSSLQLEETLFKNMDKEFSETSRYLLSANETGMEAVERIISIIRDLKNFSRIDEAEIKSVDLRESLDGTLMLMEGKLTKTIHIQKEYGNIPPVTCYPRLLNQAFLNIIENAIEAVNGNGRIVITALKSGSNVVFTFEDNGKGIPGENLPKIFDPGFTTKGVGVGTGLGLAIAYNIIRKHNGSIEVNSTEGKGTAVLITIPVSMTVP